MNTGERRFHWTIKNIGSLACATNVLLSAVNAGAAQSTGNMEPNEVKAFFVAMGDVDNVRVLGVRPGVGTSANSCRFKVRRVWFERLPQGDTQRIYLRYEVQNTGNIACIADVEFGFTPIEDHLAPRTLSSGSSLSRTWNNATPLTATHVMGMNPEEPGCAMEITRMYYRQVINSNGTTERELVWVLKNVGPIQCTVVPWLSRI